MHTRNSVQAGNLGMRELGRGWGWEFISYSFCRTSLLIDAIIVAVTGMTKAMLMTKAAVMIKGAVMTKAAVITKAAVMTKAYGVVAFLLVYFINDGTP